MYLLDTHTFLWFLSGSGKITKRIKMAVDDPGKVYISIVSFWEMTIKNSLGKLELPSTVNKMMEDCREMDMDILQISPAHLETLGSLPWIHRDPFDRMIISQAMSEGLRLITADVQIRQYDVETMW